MDDVTPETAVYVDEAIFPFRGSQYCHMWSVNVDELHRVANLLGLRREWFRDKPSFRHYDLVKGKRLVAIKRGLVIPISTESMICKNKIHNGRTEFCKELGSGHCFCRE